MNRNFTWLQRHDILPSVGVLQKLLNRGGTKLLADGIFGPHTENCVRAFQQARHMEVDGVVQLEEWNRLSAGANLQILDCVDVFDPRFLATAGAIRSLGGDPTVIGGMCNGVEQAVIQILAAARPHTVFLLRFQGHGDPGDQGVSAGDLSWDEVAGERTDIAVAEFEKIRRVLARLRPILSAYGNVEFHGCKVARGKIGAHLLQLVANTLGVPATGAVLNQPFGWVYNFRFFGPTRSRFPRGGTLGRWCKTRPDFPGMSVA